MLTMSYSVWGEFHSGQVKKKQQRNVVPYKLSLALTAFLFTIFVGAFNAQAASVYYVRSGASGSGNGSDWSNAYTTLPSTLVRGATYYVAAGTYGGYTFKTATAGSTMITVKKATVSDHGTDTGWNSSFGSGQAVFTGEITITSSYFLFDGVTGGGPGSWESGYGFKINRTGAATKCVNIPYGANPSNITLQHIDMDNCGVDTGGRSDTIYCLGATDLTVSYCWLHDTNRTNLLINASQNITIEYCLISDRHNMDDVHGEHLSANHNGLNANHIYRFNIWRDAGGANTGVIVIKDSVQSGFKIYGNLFYNEDYNTAVSSNGIITDSTGDSTTNVKIYNNTFMPHRGLNGDCPTVSFDVSSGNDFKNNIVFNAGGLVGISSSYNLYNSFSRANGETGGEYFSEGAEALFVNPSSYNFKLKGATEPGDTLSAEYMVDMLSYTREADGVWDRGAYEHSGIVGDASPEVEITFPTTAASYSTNNSMVSLEGTASDDGGIISVGWSCPTCSPSSGYAVGTTAWSIPDIGLSDGENIIQVIVTDTASQVKTDTISISMESGDFSEDESTDDMTAPVLSNLSPTGEISVINPTTLSITTNEAAICRADLSKALYEDMSMIFAAGENNNHSMNITGIDTNGAYTYYIRCRDSAGNTSDAIALSFMTNSIVTSIQAPRNLIIE